jgi:hypothetical protein
MRSSHRCAGFLLTEADLCLEQYSFMNIVENRTNTSKLASCFWCLLPSVAKKSLKTFQKRRNSLCMMVDFLESF